MITYNSTYIISVISYGLRTSLYLSAPMLVAAVSVGVIVSVFQAATQVQEQTLSFVPKIVATFLTVMFFAPFIASVITRFMVTTLQSIPHLVVQ